MKRLSLAIGLVLCFALPATAQMYKWVGSNGEVHYSDKPPPSNVKTEKVRDPAQEVAPPAAAPAEGGSKGAAKAGPKSLAEQDQAFRKRQADAAKAEAAQSDKAAEANRRAANCKYAKSALANLELGGRQTRIDAKGERVFLSDQEITQATSKARQDVADACK